MLGNCLGAIRCIYTKVPSQESIDAGLGGERNLNKRAQCLDSVAFADKPSGKTHTGLASFGGQSRSSCEAPRCVWPSRRRQDLGVWGGTLWAEWEPNLRVWDYCSSFSLNSTSGTSRPKGVSWCVSKGEPRFTWVLRRRTAIKPDLVVAAHHDLGPTQYRY